MKANITVLPGDGSGAEVTRETILAGFYLHQNTLAKATLTATYSR